ncbi:serine-threonine protein kinase 19-domain-containing protein [Syncephalis fuscata]|nr:serine-threonine protein kinase 19-domain-containing protein [Syncephalis fuscata]
MSKRSISPSILDSGTSKNDSITTEPVAIPSKRFKALDNIGNDFEENNTHHHQDNHADRSLLKQSNNNAIEGELTKFINQLLIVKSNVDTTLPRLFTRHQLYVVTDEDNNGIAALDATNIDRTIDRLFKSGHFVGLSVGAEEEEQAIMRSTDFNQLIQKACSRPSTSADCREALESLGKAATSGALFECLLNEQTLRRYLKNADEQLSLLVASGFLVTMGSDTYGLSIPNIGRFAVQLRNGRRELAQWLRRRRYRQAPMDQVVGKQLRRATLIQNQYLVWDMLGADQIEKFNTASGLFIRLTDKGERLCK